jgi:ribonuclease J
MAASEHKQIQVAPGDTVIFSARVIPGNEESIARTINRLFRLGARVITEEMGAVHVSGHASREELKLMLNLTRPAFFVPIHGETRHLHLHADLAREVGVPGDRIFVIENGDILEFNGGSGRIADKAPAGRILVDGKGIGYVGTEVLRDRQRLARDGIVVVALGVDRHRGKLIAGPEILTRGFVHEQDSATLLDEMKAVVTSVLESASEEEQADHALMKQQIGIALKKYLQRGIERRPVIESVIIEM